MESDWEIEIGGDAPAIEALWAGFVDLRRAPQRAWELPETAELPALAETLARLNGDKSPVWTAKCDHWPRLEPDAFDADEMDAEPACSAYAMGCYIDLLPRSDQQWAAPAMAVAHCRRVCELLCAVPLRCCRVDLILRQAFAGTESMGLGITAYLTACGVSAAEAAGVLEEALGAFSRAFCADSTLQ
jgi:hypothetical protein